MDTNIRNAIQSNQTKYIGLLQSLIQIRSDYENETAILSFVEQWLRRGGQTVLRVEYDPSFLSRIEEVVRPISKKPGRYCLVVRIAGIDRNRSIILNCHLDTVPPGDENQWTFGPCSGTIDQNKIFGRGAMDDKAGVVLALAIIDLIGSGRYKPRCDVCFQFVIEDETTGNGSLLCLEKGHLADGAVILDGTRGERVVNKHAGNLHFGLSTLGKPASVSVSHMGVNAAENLMDIITHLRKRTSELNKHNQSPWTEFPSPNQLVTQHFHAESPSLTVPDKAYAEIFVTYLLPHTPQSMQVQIQEWVEEVAAHTGGEFSLHWGGFSAAPVEGNTAALETCICDAAKLVDGREVMVSASTGTSDMRHFVRRNIPCVLYGPGKGHNPHRCDEYYELEDLNVMTAILIQTIENWATIGT